MEKTFSNHWNKSKSPRKQRKFRAQAPLHIKGKFVYAPLSSELKKKHGVRNVRVRSGDKVKVLRGQFKGHIGKVEKIDLQNEYVHIEKAERSKKDGGKLFYPIHPSNVIIQELVTDRTRQKRFDRVSAGRTKEPTEKKASAAKTAAAKKTTKKATTKKSTVKKTATKKAVKTNDN